MQNVTKADCASRRAFLVGSQEFKDFKKTKKRVYVSNDPSSMIGWVGKYGWFDYHQCISLEKSRRKRASRCRNKIQNWFGDGLAVSFVTLTFTDKVLSKTKEKTRRRYVSRFLKARAKIYLANIDFGDKEKNPQSNEREHYHALVVGVLDDDQWHEWIEKYGFYKVEVVKYNAQDLTKVSKYVAKLSNHSLKAKNGVAPRLIYSRDATGLLEPPSWLFK